MKAGLVFLLSLLALYCRWELGTLTKVGKYLATIGIFFFIAFIATTMAYAEDLTGIWSATGYTCPWARNEPPSQTIRIVQNGSKVEATKITGDDCLGAGEVTWRGAFQNNVFTEVKMQIRGDPNNKWFIVATAKLKDGQIILDGAGAVMTFTRTREPAKN